MPRGGLISCPLWQYDTVDVYAITIAVYADVEYNHKISVLIAWVFRLS